jgi:guanylate kinase
MNETTGNLFVVSAPSGAGKSSLLRSLLQREPGLRVAVSHTTRPPRPAERDGEHYHFVEPNAFKGLVEEGAFLEHARVFDYFYGTSESAVRGALEAGEDLVLEIDWQGAQQVRRRFPDACSIFILPPSVATLRERLTGRGQDGEAVHGAGWVILRRAAYRTHEICSCVGTGWPPRPCHPLQRFDIIDFFFEDLDHFFWRKYGAHHGGRLPGSL